MADEKWKEEQVSIAKRLWADGLSASKVAEELNRLFMAAGFFFTRNSVLSKLHRTGSAKRLTGTLNQLPKTPRPRQQKLTRITLKTKPIIDSMPIETSLTEPLQRKALTSLKTQECRYPYGEFPFMFCGEPTNEGVSWCPYHTRIVFQPRVHR